MEPHTPYDPPRGWDTFGRDDHARYLGEIRYGDSEIGRLLDELEALGRSHDTLVVFLADHGEAFNEHGYHEHGYTVHREEVQVPLILRWPGVIPAGTRVAARVASIDVHATIAELMGLPQPRHVEGASLLPLLGPGAPQADRTVYSELLVAPRENTAPPQMGLYEGDWKLILYL
jgi:arylsulfatase A-like enzyme